ncbi:lysozyme inhibitor LprI family protein [Luteibacter rhizovicinus]|nr:lysozyme inhibitor LprI family protein [Luteibacter rhizovicinus]
MSQSAMNMCADQAYKKTDAELNTVYRQITSRLKDDKEKTKLLLVAQKNWLAFRDAECTFTTSASAQGSIYPMLVAQCRDGLTRRRIDDLKGYMTCEEGDMSCPVPSK